MDLLAFKCYMWFDVCIKLDVIELVLYYFLEILAGTQPKYLGWDTLDGSLKNVIDHLVVNVTSILCGDQTYKLYKLSSVTKY